MTTPMGEWGDLAPATQEIEDICIKVKPEVESQSNRQFQEFFAYAYRHNQMLGGGTYVVKVYVGQGESILLTIGDMLTQAGNTYSLKKLEEGKKPYDPIQI